MARIEGIQDDQASALTRAVFRGAKQRAGQVPDPLRIMALSKSVMWAAGFYELASAKGSRVPAALKALAGVKAAAMIGCVF
ncbi:MAG: hypothetical protein AAF430_08330 [Myxococcota bacterium]